MKTTLPLLAVAGHTAIVVFVAVAYALIGGEASALWAIFVLLDFPSSLIFGWLIGIVESWSRDVFGVRFTYSITFPSL
jgi:hypothetical protein